MGLKEILEEYQSSNIIRYVSETSKTMARRRQLKGLDCQSDKVKMENLIQRDDYPEKIEMINKYQQNI